jgi:hypothetical protein
MWLYDKVGWSVRQPSFYVSASTTAVANPSDFDPEYYRVFCGFSEAQAKYCVMHAIVPADGVGPEKWPLDAKLHTKVVFLGDRNRPVYISWLSTFSGTGGSAVLRSEKRKAYVGQGIGCDGGIAQPIAGLYGEIPVMPGESILVQKISERIRLWMVGSDADRQASSDISCKPSTSVTFNLLGPRIGVASFRAA